MPDWFAIVQFFKDNWQLIKDNWGVFVCWTILSIGIFCLIHKRIVKKLKAQKKQLEINYKRLEERLNKLDEETWLSSSRMKNIGDSAESLSKSIQEKYK